MNRLAEKIQRWLGALWSTMLTFAKVALQSRRPFPKGQAKERGLVVMGNGPSLRETIDSRGEWLAEHDLMSVNFAANATDFRDLKPSCHILADGHFFEGAATDPNVAKLWENLGKVDWNMRLYVPWKYGREAWRLLGKHGFVTTEVFNLTPGEGFPGVLYPLFDAGLAMPRPRNVLVPAIMTAIRDGYRKIYLAGADHSWTKTLDVDSENFVVSVQPHFYKDNEEEHRRVRKAYAGLRLHDVLGSMTVAFRSYWEISGYAKSRGVEIVNSTPGSMIDAFPREAH